MHVVFALHQIDSFSDSVYLKLKQFLHFYIYACVCVYVYMYVCMCVCILAYWAKDILNPLREPNISAVLNIVTNRLANSIRKITARGVS